MLSFTYVMCQKIPSERGNKGGIKISGVRSAILWSLLMSSGLSKTGNRKYFGMKMFHRYKARLIFFSIFLWLLFLHLRISWKILRAVLSFRAGFLFVVLVYVDYVSIFILLFGMYLDEKRINGFRLICVKDVCGKI